MDRGHVERMADFFDARYEGYEEHMKRSIASFDRFYRSVADPIAETDEMVRILDIGCGTGLELEAVFSKVPNAAITGIDVSQRMLSKLRDKYADRAKQLHLLRGSYLDLPLGESIYDYVVAVMTLHHLLPAAKRDLYRRIGRALKGDGAYVEGDWVVTAEEERHYVAEYEARLSEIESTEEGSHHIDVPLSLETEKRLLIEAGFSPVDVIWRGAGNAVYVAHAAEIEGRRSYAD